LYFKTAEELINAINNGLGDISFGYANENNQLSAALKQNIYAFSAAKSLVQMIQYRDMMVGADGQILSYGSFKKVIADQGEIFNNQFLQAEYQHAQQSAIMAQKWNSLDTPYLEFSTVNDGRVRPEHKALNKFTAPKDSAVWNRIYPPLGWGCRCTVVPNNNGKSNNSLTEIEAGTMIKPLVKDTIFDNNVGKSKMIFDDKHAYFISANGKQNQLSWEQYGLESLEKIRANSLESYQPTTKEEYLNWWEKQPKFKGDDIVIMDALNQEILLTSGTGKTKSSINYYKDHILKKSKENRFVFATESQTILKNPDEIWYNDQGRVYIKYYEQGAIKLVVNDLLEAKTIFELSSEGDLKKARKGVLLHKK
jgi:SPP1 gp7 family putative phage head morphogenesis protein